MLEPLDDIYARVFENNGRWIAEKTAADPEFFSRLSRDQNPDFLFIGCADSRVPANEIMGLEPGDVFVHRNVANIVPNTDMNCHAVLEIFEKIREIYNLDDEIAAEMGTGTGNTA